jgi:hypothetical protein
MPDSARNRLKKLLGGKPTAPAEERSIEPPVRPTTPQSSATLSTRYPLSTLTAPSGRLRPQPSGDLPDSFAEANLYLQELRSKMARVAEEFAQGKLNRAQFHEIYTHYQQQRAEIEAVITNMPGSDAWRGVVSTGHTTMLRQRNAAQILSYSLYDNSNSLPLASGGQFKLDADLVVPMLSSFRSATQEIFGKGVQNTEIEGGRWLCFVPGQYTTLFVVFSVEPARIQVALIQDLHRDFETAQAQSLAKGEGRDAAAQFINMWARDWKLT